MSYANRGKWLESVITHVNQIYEMNNKAIIRKVPTDINYNTRTGKAFFKAKGMVDFVGISNGKMIALDRKSVPYSYFENIDPVQSRNGIAFDYLDIM